MISYRPFHNTDPPRITALWNTGQLGRGAAAGISTDALEVVTFGQPYFERDGLILACDGDRAVGFVHAGFGTTADESTLDRSRGVICAIVVHPEYRRQGIGRELLTRAEDWLRSQGAESITAGQSTGTDPFYLGLYGGTRLSGFLESDSSAAPFFLATGYEAGDRTLILQRDLTRSRDPVSMRLVSMRRKTQLGVRHQPVGASWWWFSRFGRLDTIDFVLTPRGETAPSGSMTVLGLDFYLPCWGERVVGLTRVEVSETLRRQGIAQTLILDTCRRLKDESYTRVEAHCAETNSGFLSLLQSMGFEEVDAGVAYHRG